MKKLLLCCNFRVPPGTRKSNLWLKLSETKTCLRKLDRKKKSKKTRKSEVKRANLAQMSHAYTEDQNAIGAMKRLQREVIAAENQKPSVLSQSIASQGSDFTTPSGLLRQHAYPSLAPPATPMAAPISPCATVLSQNTSASSISLAGVGGVHVSGSAPYRNGTTNEINMAGTSGGNGTTTGKVSALASSSTVAIPSNTATLIDEDSYDSFGQQPCPASLRMMVAFCQENIHEKLTLAGITNIKDCLRYIYQSRALLDRLLKEIPLLGEFHEGFSRVADESLFNQIQQQQQQQQQQAAQPDDAALVSMGGAMGNKSLLPNHGRRALQVGEVAQNNTNVNRNATQVQTQSAKQTVTAKIQQYLQEFRRMDTTSSHTELPSVHFVESAKTGKITPRLLLPSSGLGQNEGQLPNSESPRNTKRSLIEVYESQLQAKGDEQETFSTTRVGNELQKQTTSKTTAKRSATANASIALNSGAVSTGVSSLSYEHNSMRLSSRSSPPVVSSAEMQQFLIWLRERTERIATATQTDDTIAKMVDERIHKEALAEIDRLRNDCRDLQRMNQENESEIRLLRNAVTSRATAVTHLRQTLFKECAILKNQLFALSHEFAVAGGDVNKVIANSNAYQLAIQQYQREMQQYAQQQGSNGGKRGAGGGTMISPTSSTVLTPSNNNNNTSQGCGSRGASFRIQRTTTMNSDASRSQTPRTVALPPPVGYTPSSARGIIDGEDVTHAGSSMGRRSPSSPRRTAVNNAFSSQKLQQQQQPDVTNPNSNSNNNGTGGLLLGDILAGPPQLPQINMYMNNTTPASLAFNSLRNPSLSINNNNNAHANSVFANTYTQGVGTNPLGSGSATPTMPSRITPRAAAAGMVPSSLSGSMAAGFGRPSNGGPMPLSPTSHSHAHDGGGGASVAPRPPTSSAHHVNGASLTQGRPRSSASFPSSWINGIHDYNNNNQLNTTNNNSDNRIVVQNSIPLGGADGSSGLTINTIFSLLDAVLLGVEEGFVINGGSSAFVASASAAAETTGLEKEHQQLNAGRALQKKESVGDFADRERKERQASEVSLRLLGGSNGGINATAAYSPSVANTPTPPHRRVGAAGVSTADVPPKRTSATSLTLPAGSPSGVTNHHTEEALIVSSSPASASSPILISPSSVLINRAAAAFAMSNSPLTFNINKKTGELFGFGGAATTSADRGTTLNTMSLSHGTVFHGNQNIDGNQLFSEIPERRVIVLQEELRARQHKWKQDYIDMQQRQKLQIARREREIKRLKEATNVEKLQENISATVTLAKEELLKMREGVEGTIEQWRQEFQLFSSQISAVVMEMVREVQESRKALAVHNAALDLIRAACELLLPILNPEYALGVHPCVPASATSSTMGLPLTEPLWCHVKAHHGEEAAAELRHEIQRLQQLFLHLQKHCLADHQLPHRGRPAHGSLMRRLGKMLLLSQHCTQDLAVQIREILELEQFHSRELAKFTFRLVSVTFRQQAIVSRCKAALLEAGLNPATMNSLPCSGAVSRLSAKLISNRNLRQAVTKLRMDNAKKLWDLWSKNDIDIYSNVSSNANPEDQQDAQSHAGKRAGGGGGSILRKDVAMAAAQLNRHLTMHGQLILGLMAPAITFVSNSSQAVEFTARGGGGGKPSATAGMDKGLVAQGKKGSAPLASGTPNTAQFNGAGTGNASLEAAKSKLYREAVQSSAFGKTSTGDN